MATASLDELEKLSTRLEAEKQAQTAITTARATLVLGKEAKAAFFARLALHLDDRPEWSIPTAATDGKRLLYNPEFINTLKPPEVVGLMAHEVLHNALAHMSRRGDRDHQLFNVAADLAINGMLNDDGFALPTGGLFAGEGQFKDFPKGLSAEEYYELIPPQMAQQFSGNDPGGCGGVMDASGDPHEMKESARQWKELVAEAACLAQQRGELPAGLRQFVGAVVAPEPRWQDVLQDFMSGVLTNRDDYSWRRPNRRFVSQGLYLPCLASESIGHIVIACDTSGSMSALLPAIAREMSGILACNPCRVSIVYCDAAIQKEEEWTPADGDLFSSGVEMPGGGGTSHRPVWEWLDTLDAEPMCVVCVTDGYTDFGEGPGDIPVLWAILDNPGCQVPFGRAIYVK